MTTGLHRTVPALPVRDVQAALAHYVERFGFEVRHHDGDFAVIIRDDAVLHLWGATDESWRTRPDLADRPICSGAESFIAGTASCRIEVTDVDAVYAELQPRTSSTRSPETASPPPTSEPASSPPSTPTATSSASSAGPERVPPGRVELPLTG